MKQQVHIKPQQTNWQIWRITIVSQRVFTRPRKCAQREKRIIGTQISSSKVRSSYY